MKMPAFQFYPADWRKDPGVQALSFHDRGVWFEVLCLMHESTERGVLLLNGHPMPEAALARAIGLDNQTLNQTLTTLLTYGVASKRESDGALYSRRMVKDESLCQVRREAGKKGGNPNLVNQNSTTRDNQTPTPSSSSSTSTSSKEDEKGTAASAAPPAPKLRASRGGKSLMAETPLADFQTFAAAWHAAVAAHPDTYAPFAGVDLAHYHAALLDWSSGGGAKKADWLATIRGSIRRDATDGKLRRLVAPAIPTRQPPPRAELNHEFIAQQEAAQQAAFQARLAQHAAANGALTQTQPCSQTKSL